MQTATPRQYFPLRGPAAYSFGWLLAIFMYVAGDTVTTLAIVRSPAHQEANLLVAAAAAQFGGLGVVLLKALAVGVCLWVSVHIGLRDNDRLFTYGPPALLFVLGAGTTVANLGLLN